MGWKVNGDCWRRIHNLFAWKEELLLDFCIVFETVFVRYQSRHMNLVSYYWWWESCQKYLSNAYPRFRGWFSSPYWQCLDRVSPVESFLVCMETLCNRLLIKENLNRCEIISNGSLRFLGGCGKNENLSHLIFLVLFLWGDMIPRFEAVVHLFCIS